MLKDYEISGCLSAPGLAIGSGGKTTFKYANTVVAMVKGLLADAVTTADAPALTTAKNSVDSVPGDLAIDYERAYTLLASINETTGALTFSLAASEDFAEGHVWKQTDFNFGNSKNNDSHKAVIGVVIIANTTNAFVPGTTALDATGVTVRYIDNIVSLHS
jgi:hypothetical protein